MFKGVWRALSVGLSVLAFGAACYTDSAVSPLGVMGAPVGRPGTFSGREAPIRGLGNPEAVKATATPELAPSATPVASRLGWKVPSKVPILMYHYIRVNPDPRDKLGEDLSVRPEVFDQQMSWLASHGYHSVTLQAVVRSWKEGHPLPDRPVVLTFDDGYRDVYTAAFPAMERYGFVGVVFAVTNFVGRAGYASAEELQRLEGKGWEIGAHSMNHVDLTRLGPDALRREVLGSASGLGKLLGSQPVSFAYPAGRWNSEVERTVAQAGIEAAVTTQWGVAKAGSDPWALPRLRIRGSTNIESFSAILTSVDR